MKGLLWGFFVVFSIITLVIVSLFARGCNTTSRMADETVFNAERHVWTYEQFHAQYAQYKQYGQQRIEAEEKLAELEQKGIKSGQRYDNLANEIDGIRNMMRRIAADYNKMSEIAYQGVWKSRGLPDKLGG